MINKDVNIFTFDDIVKVAFKCKNIEFDEFKFYHWKYTGSYEELEQIVVSKFSNNGFAEGKYSLLTDTAQIHGLDQGSFEILNFCVSAKYIKNKWTDIKHKFDDLDFWHQATQTNQAYLLQRENKINENIEKSLKMLCRFSNMFKHRTPF